MSNPFSTGDIKKSSESSEPSKKNTGFIICIVVLFLLVLLLLLGYYSLNSTIKSNSDDISDLEDSTTAITYSTLDSSTNFSSNVAINKTLTVGNTNVESSITSLQNNITGISYSSDVTYINQTAQIPAGQTLMIGNMDVYSEINSLNADLTSGIASIDNLILSTLDVTGEADFSTINNSGTLNTNALTVTGSSKTTSISNAGNIQTGSLNGVQSQTIGFLDATSSIQTQLNDTVKASESNTFVALNTFKEGAQILHSTAGYMLTGNGVSFQPPVPVICSMSKFFQTQMDNLWIVNPGFKFCVYNLPVYNVDSTIETFDNTTGSTPLWIQPTTQNTCMSIKVYFLDVEIVGPGNISYPQ